MDYRVRYRFRPETIDNEDLDFGIAEAKGPDPLADFPLLRQHIKTVSLDLGHRLEKAGIEERDCLDAWCTARVLATEAALVMKAAILSCLEIVDDPPPTKPGADIPI